MKSLCPRSGYKNIQPQGPKQCLETLPGKGEKRRLAKRVTVLFNGPHYIILSIAPAPFLSEWRVFFRWLIDKETHHVCSWLHGPWDKSGLIPLWDQWMPLSPSLECVLQEAYGLLPLEGWSAQKLGSRTVGHTLLTCWTLCRRGWPLC